MVADLSKKGNNTNDDIMINTINDDFNNGETNTSKLNNDLLNKQEIADSHLIDTHHTEKAVLNREESDIVTNWFTGTIGRTRSTEW